jgi:hypothetical protein
VGVFAALAEVGIEAEEDEGVFFGHVRGGVACLGPGWFW